MPEARSEVETAATTARFTGAALGPRRSGPYPLPLAHRAEIGRGQRLQLALAEHYFRLHAFVLIGLALMGRGFAYLGVPPLFISEVTLALGCGLFLMQDGVRRIFASPQAVMILLLAGWGVIRAVPYYGAYGVDAIRDWMLLGYMAWAVVIGGLIVARPQRLAEFILRYRTFCMVLAVCLPITYVMQMTGANTLLPGVRGVPLVQLKVGDTLVQSATVGAFLIVGLVPSIAYNVALYVPMALLLFALCNRAGQVAMLCALGCAFVVRGFNNAVARAGAIVLFCTMSLFVVSGGEVTIPGIDRVISVDKLADRLVSTVVTTGNSRFDNSKAWRLNWWSDIVNYTVFGEYFWQGKGFGVNLATVDGYQVGAADELRSPHNSHLNVLARAGVPGFGLYVALHATWAWAIGARLMHARRIGRTSWAKLFAVLLVFWLTYMLNASVDVVLEGPMAAVWFWTIFGVGMASLWIYDHAPEVLADARPARARTNVAE